MTSLLLTTILLRHESVYVTLVLASFVTIFGRFILIDCYVGCPTQVSSCLARADLSIRNLA